MPAPSVNPVVVKQTPQTTYAHPLKTTTQRKLAKLKKDPYLFFNDSQKPLLKVYDCSSKIHQSLINIM